jgi:hypothetical protein
LRHVIQTTASATLRDELFLALCGPSEEQWSSVIDVLKLRQQLAPFGMTYADDALKFNMLS